MSGTSDPMHLCKLTLNIRTERDVPGAVGRDARAGSGGRATIHFGAAAAGAGAGTGVKGGTGE